jgi:hypothetical protein
MNVSIELYPAADHDPEQSVVFAPTTGELVHLNATALHFSTIAREVGGDVETVSQRISGHYGIPITQARTDFLAVAETLRQHGLAVITP